MLLEIARLLGEFLSIVFLRIYIGEICHYNPESIDTNKTVIFPFVCMKLRPSFSLYYIVVGIDLEQHEVSPTLVNFDLGP